MSAAPRTAARRPDGAPPARIGPVPARDVPEPPPARRHRCCVLDELPELGADLPPSARAAARSVAMAPSVRLDPGPAPVQDWFGTSLHGPGLLVLHGLLGREVRVAGRPSCELLGTSDLLRPWELDADDPVPCTVAWRVIAPAEVAVLDAFFADRIRPWPLLASELMASAVRRARSLALLRAISCHPRVDMRVAMLLWHLAGRWGRIGPDGGVRLEVPLTHRLIGELIGAERPSVSHALSRLAQADLVVRAGDGWHLYGTPEDAAAAALRPLPPH